MSKYHLISICNTFSNVCKRTMLRHVGLRQPPGDKVCTLPAAALGISTPMESPLLPLKPSEFVPRRTCCESQPPVPLKSVSTESFLSSAFGKKQ